MLGDQPGERFLGDVAGGKLRAHVAEHAHRQANVLLQYAKEGLVRLAGVVHLDGRDAKPFLEDLGRVRCVRAGHPAAHVGLVADGRRESHPSAFVEDRLEDEHVGKMHSAFEGIVQRVDVARPHPVAVAPDRGGERIGERGQVAGQGQSLRHRPALRVAEGRRVVHVVLEHAGVRGPQDSEGHLVGDGQQRVLEQLEADGIGEPGGHRSDLHHDVARDVEPRPGARRHYARRVVLLDDRRTLARRREIAARQDLCHDPAVARTEVDAAGARDRARGS